MSKLDEMIRELCPDGVEYVKLGTLCSLITKQTGFDYTNHIKARLLMEPAENAVPYIQTKFFAGKTLIIKQTIMCQWILWSSFLRLRWMKSVFSFLLWEQVLVMLACFRANASAF